MNKNTGSKTSNIYFKDKKLSTGSSYVKHKRFRRQLNTGKPCKGRSTHLLYSDEFSQVIQ